MRDRSYAGGESERPSRKEKKVRRTPSPLHMHLPIAVYACSDFCYVHGIDELKVESMNTVSEDRVCLLDTS